MGMNLVTSLAGEVGVTPRLVRGLTADTLDDVTTAGYITPFQQTNDPLFETDFVMVSYDVNKIGIFQPLLDNGVVTLQTALVPIEGDSVIGNIPDFVDTDGTMEDSGVALASIVLNNAPQTISNTTASATPGTIRSFKSVMTGSATTMTSGNLVGARGEADIVGASGGFIYGVQGKVIPTGTLSGSVWVAAVFGQFDFSHPAVLNAGQCATIWGDWGATGGTATNLTGCRGFAFTNTTANVINAQIYLYGPATNLLELADNSGAYGASYYVAAGTSAGSAGDASHCAAQKVIKISVNGSAAYIPVFTQNT